MIKYYNIFFESVIDLKCILQLALKLLKENLHGKSH